MPSLILSGDTVSVRLESKHLEVIRRPTEDDAPTTSLRVPLHDLERAVLVGRPNVSVAALQRLMLEGVPCYFLSAHGRWIGSLTPDNNRNAARRICQYEKANDQDLALRIARPLVNAKIRNSRRVLQRLAANREESAEPEQTVVTNRLEQLADHALRTANMDELRGYEGLAAATYFARLGRFFPTTVPFKERSRRPPRNPANALLSWTYAILLGEVEGAVRAHGLDACIGFLHGIAHGTPSLALDLLEPFRAPMCDLLALNLLNHRVLTEESFRFDTEDNGFYLKEECHREFFYAYEHAMTRKFVLIKGAPHTDFRQAITESVLTVIRALEGGKEIGFFQMP